MVEETIKTIKETENEADEIIRKKQMQRVPRSLKKAAREAKKEIKRAGCSKCKETGRSRSFAGEKEEGEVLKNRLREDGTGDRSIKSTGSGKEEAVSAVIKALL